ncbi:MAG: type II toxin-antitoxin system PemK/MazF family toxin [bacterium]|nr:type II toxin-antitoxin system PemK/MazF family toxin [bacterium]
MRLQPGDVVVADFPGISGVKRRPASVVSTELYNKTRPDTTLGVLTGQVAKSTARTDYLLADWGAASLRVPTAFRTFLVTLPNSDIVARIGRLSSRDWVAIQTRLRLSVAV